MSGPAPQQWGWLLHSRIVLREMRDPLERRQPRGLPAALAVVTRASATALGLPAVEAVLHVARAAREAVARELRAPVAQLLMDVFHRLPREALGAQALATVALLLVPIVDPRLPLGPVHALPVVGHVPRQTRLARQIDALGDLEAVLRLARALRLSLSLDSHALLSACLLVLFPLLSMTLLFFDYCVRLSFDWRLHLLQGRRRALLSGLMRGARGGGRRRRGGCSRDTSLARILRSLSGPRVSTTNWCAPGLKRNAASIKVSSSRRLGEALASALPSCRTAASTNSRSCFSSAEANMSALPYCCTAAKTTSWSCLSSAEACWSARPPCCTAASTTSRSFFSSAEASWSARPSRCTAASTISRSCLSSVEACLSAMPLCCTTVSMNSRS
eukprot:scaffold136433_cov69-Phaeocystis_antarctica.AAC.4